LRRVDALTWKGKKKQEKESSKRVNRREGLTGLGPKGLNPCATGGYKPETFRRLNFPKKNRVSSGNRKRGDQSGQTFEMKTIEEEDQPPENNYLVSAPGVDGTSNLFNEIVGR